MPPTDAKTLQLRCQLDYYPHPFDVDDLHTAPAELTFRSRIPRALFGKGGVDGGVG